MFTIKSATNISWKPPALFCLASFSTPMPTTQVYNLYSKGPSMQTATHSQRSTLREGTGDQGRTWSAEGMNCSCWRSHSQIALLPWDPAVSSPYNHMHTQLGAAGTYVQALTRTRGAVQTQWVWLYVEEGSCQISHPGNG